VKQRERERERKCEYEEYKKKTEKVLFCLFVKPEFTSSVGKKNLTGKCEVSDRITFEKKSK